MKVPPDASPMTPPHTQGNAPFVVLVKLVAAIFIAEAGVMRLLPWLALPQGMVTHFVDATLLAAISLPCIYWLVVRPLQRAQREIQGYAERLKSVNEELARSNRDLEEFTYTVSHDLQEPLRKVHAFAQFLVEDCGEHIPPQGREHLRRMQNAAVRMKDLIQHLLRLARVGSRGGKIVPVDPRESLDKVLDTLSEQVRECGAEIDVEDGLPVVVADAVQLGQVFQNLIGNALKFCSPERAPKVTVTAEVEGERATFSVSDNGIGVEERFLEKIFGLFQRLHPREQYEGAGVGLALCERIIRRHGGRMWAESEVGKGTTFRFTLPTRLGGKEEGCEA